MRIATCRLLEGGSITVQTVEASRTFRGGDTVDLDAIAAPAVEGRAAETWADALGEHVEAFKVSKRAAPAPRPGRRQDEDRVSGDVSTAPQESAQTEE